MTDDARIERLTELARRVWPDARMTVQKTWREPAGGDYASVMLSDGKEVVALIEHTGRLLDALEAALLVLADEDRIPLTERQVLEDRLRACERDRAALVKRYEERTAWVEQLASVWEESAQYLSDFSTEPPAQEIRRQVDTLRRCARELRERARGEKP